jgi:endonuclease-8
MPEGHTLHRLARDLNDRLAGQAVRVSSPQGRFPDAERLDGKLLRRAEAVGKHLLLHFRGGAVVHIHLGLFGRFRSWRHPAPAPRPSTRLRLGSDGSTWDLSGPTACERLSAAEVRALRARLGADPLAENADPAPAIARIRKSRRPIGALLLDQGLFAGLGNVYRAEILFLVGLHPLQPGRTISEAQLMAIWTLARALLARGVEARRIVTVATAGKRVRGREALHVYRRRACRACEAPIVRLLVGGRAMYACERCQPPSSD